MEFVVNLSDQLRLNGAGTKLIGAFLLVFGFSLTVVNELNQKNRTLAFEVQNIFEFMLEKGE